MKRKPSRNLLFDLGDFVIDPELRGLLSVADVQALLARHARGDWGNVNRDRREANRTFIHPKNRAFGSNAQSVYAHKNALVCILTRQGKNRRKTELFLL